MDDAIEEGALATLRHIEERLVRVERRLAGLKAEVAQRREVMPFWPRGLREPLAAAYVGLSTTTFRQVVMPVVPAVRLTPGRIVWYREDLDAWLDRRKPGMLVDDPAQSGEASDTEAIDVRAANAEGIARLAAKRRPRRPQPPG